MFVFINLLTLKFARVDNISPETTVFNVFFEKHHTFTACDTRQTMYVLHNIEARLCNHCCSGKAISITYSECVSVAVYIQNAKRMHHSVFCCLSGCNIVPRYHKNGTIKKIYQTKLNLF